jgi:hypothetical protein
VNVGVDKCFIWESTKIFTMRRDEFGILLTPSLNEFESYAVLNPTAYQHADHAHLSYRAARRITPPSVMHYLRALPQPYMGKAFQ